MSLRLESISTLLSSHGLCGRGSWRGCPPARRSYAARLVFSAALTTVTTFDRGKSIIDFLALFPRSVEDSWNGKAADAAAYELPKPKVPTDPLGSSDGSRRQNNPLMPSHHRLRKAILLLPQHQPMRRVTWRLNILHHRVANSRTSPAVTLVSANSA